jgi:hypothetical protein
VSTMAQYITALQISRKLTSQYQDNYFTAFSSKSGIPTKFPTFYTKQRENFSFIHFNPHVSRQPMI